LAYDTECNAGEQSGEGWFDCDSVWRSYDNGATWERIYHGDWSDYSWSSSEFPNILLRLPCDDTEDCCTIYMGIQGTKELYYSRDCGQCWNKAVNQKLEIQDFAVESENIVYILDDKGYVSKSTQYGRRPSDGVDTGVGSGHTITSCCDAGLVLVGGAADEPVAWSDDGGETWDLTDDLPGNSYGVVHVACDTACSTDPIIYAATDEGVAASGGAILRCNLNEGSWDDLNANDYPYTGIALGKSDGTLYASSYWITIDSDESICDRFVSIHDSNADEAYSGVARNLTPCETACCGEEDWDYLIAGLSTVCFSPCQPMEEFGPEPSSLKICGCLTSSTNSVLWAIDWGHWYNVISASDCGLLWSYEDCAAKHGPTLTSPEDGAIVACDVCASCESAAMTLKWQRMCLACSYDIEIMDENGNTIVEIVDKEITGSPPSLYLDEKLECGRTYTWHVREANTETGECVHSPWSEIWSFTVEASSENAVKLIAPKQGDTVYQRTGVGFSWTSVYDANKYTFVLSAKPDLSGALATAEVTGTAYAYSGTLDYETTYYWQVTAWKGSTMMSQSDIGTFAIAAEEYIPPEPQPTPPPVVNIPPTQHIVPTWIYAVIGIGAACSEQETFLTSNSS